MYCMPGESGIRIWESSQITVVDSWIPFIALYSYGEPHSPNASIGSLPFARALRFTAHARGEERMRSVSPGDTPTASFADEVNIAWRNIVYDVPTAASGTDAKKGARAGDNRRVDGKNVRHVVQQRPPPGDSHSVSHGSGKPKTKRVLHGLSGHVHAGQVVAVMGPSGSGKTSLIHILGGRRESGVTGSFVIDGQTHQTTRSLLGDIGYVTQEDVLLNSLTTKETLMFATRLRLADRKLDVGDEPGQSKTRAAAVAAIVERAIDDFDLSRAANSPIGLVGQGGISGGEKRRLVIAMECVHRPKVLLLDEPTSGLDATTALMVVNKLRNIANGERGAHRAAIVTSIHQPRSSIMPLFDNVVLLADGREMYCGPTYSVLPGGGLSEDGVMGWLKDVGYPCPTFESPPDYLLDLINSRVDEDNRSGEDGGAVAREAARVEGGGAIAVRDRSVVVKELAAFWVSSERCRAYQAAGEKVASDVSVSSVLRPSVTVRSAAAAWCTRFGALFGRTLLFKFREPSAVATQALNSILIPLIVGSIYFQMKLTVSAASDRLSGISLICLLQSFMAFDQLLLFPKERNLYLHESNGGMYSTSVYYWARSLVELFFVVLFALVCSVISYEMFGLDDSADGRVAFYAVVAAVTTAGASFLTAIGSLCKSFEQTNALAGTLLIILMLFDGNWINRRNIPVYYRWLPEVSFLGYAVEAAVASDFRRHSFTCTQRAIDEEGCVPLTGRQILRSLQFDPDATWPKFWLLVGVAAAYRLVAFLGLHFCWTGQTFKERWSKLIGR